MTDFPWHSRFIYGLTGSETNWRTRLPTRPWKRATWAVGGSRTSASGTPAAHVVRRDYNLILPLRLWEAELADLSALLEWAQGAESFLWYPDASESGTRYEVYLESPLAGETWQETRDPSFSRVSEIELTLRRVDGYAWDLEYFE